MSSHSADAEGGMCACEEPGALNSGFPGILAGVPSKIGKRYIERCDSCERYKSDEDACYAYVRMRGGRCTHDNRGFVAWLPLRAFN